MTGGASPVKVPAPRDASDEARPVSPGDERAPQAAAHGRDAVRKVRREDHGGALLSRCRAPLAHEFQLAAVVFVGPAELDGHAQLAPGVGLVDMPVEAPAFLVAAELQRLLQAAQLEAVALVRFEQQQADAVI